MRAQTTTADRPSAPLRALVLSGGAGTRLRPITHTSAKQLVPVANKPVLFYALEALRDAGIADVGMIVGDTHSEIRAAVGDGGRWDLRVTYLRQTAPRGLADCVRVASDYLGDDDFVFYLGDNFLAGGIGELLARHLAGRPDASLLLARVTDPRQFGVAELDGGGRVVRLHEKPPVPPSDLALMGVAVFGPAIHTAVRAVSPSARNELEITDAISWLLDEGYDVRSSVHPGYWKDTGRLEDVLECNRVVLESVTPLIRGHVDAASRLSGRVVLEDGARVERSVIRGPVIIGRNTRIADSYVGPYTSIDHSCVVEGSEIEHSIVLESSVIRQVARIEDSLIGRCAEVREADPLPRAHRLLLGDHSRVAIGRQ